MTKNLSTKSIKRWNALHQNGGCVRPGVSWQFLVGSNWSQITAIWECRLQLTAVQRHQHQAPIVPRLQTAFFPLEGNRMSCFRINTIRPIVPETVNTALNFSLLDQEEVPISIPKLLPSKIHPSQCTMNLKSATNAMKSVCQRGFHHTSKKPRAPTPQQERERERGDTEIYSCSLYEYQYIAPHSIVFSQTMAS